MSGYGVEWAEIRRRLEAAERALAQDSAELPERTAPILRERARQLAQPIDAETHGEAALRGVLVCCTAGSRYAIEASQACEILPVELVTAVPGAPPYVAGMMNRRGEILLLVDLGRLLGVDRGGLADLERIVVVGAPGHEVGLMVEAIEGIQELAEADIGPPLEQDGPVAGIVQGRIVLLDVAALLSDERIAGPGPSAGEKNTTDRRSGTWAR